MNHRFQDYVTSGAFRLTLTRSQISSLSMLARGGQEWMTNGPDLERKGLADAIPSSRPDKIVYCISAAGIATLGLCSIAGLTNSTPESGGQVAYDNMIAALGKANERTRDLEELLSAAHAKLSLCERALIAAHDEIGELTSKNGQEIKVRLKPELITPRDRWPEISLSALLGMISAAVPKENGRDRN